MDVSTINPSEMSPTDAKDMAVELVNANRQAIDHYGMMVVAPSVDMADDNEKELSAVYKPLVKKGTQEVKNNEDRLNGILVDLTTQALGQVAAHKGQLENIKNTILEKGTHGNNPVSFDSQYIGGHGIKGRKKVLRRKSDSTSFDEPPLPERTLPNATIATPISDFIGIGATIQPTPIAPGPVAPSPPIVLQSALKSPTGQLEYIDPQGCKHLRVGPCGPPAINFIPPVCPAGYRAQFGPDECWECVSTDCVQVQPPPIPSPPPTPQPNPVPSCIDLSDNPCPPGYHYTYTYPPGTIECHPDAVVQPKCPKPIGGCAEGMDWWNDPATGIWKCTPGGLPPPKPSPIPQLTCEKIVNGIVINVPMTCDQLPKEYREQLAKCGFGACITEPKDTKLSDTGPKPEWSDLALRMALLMGGSLTG